MISSIIITCAQVEFCDRSKCPRMYVHACVSVCICKRNTTRKSDFLNSGLQWQWWQRLWWLSVAWPILPPQPLYTYGMFHIRWTLYQIAPLTLRERLQLFWVVIFPGSDLRHLNIGRGKTSSSMHGQVFFLFFCLLLMLLFFVVVVFYLFFLLVIFVKLLGVHIF